VAAPADLRSVGGADNDVRFEIHRRNRRHALIDALAARFPVVESLVGAEFFHALADEYVRRDPPRSPALLVYGTRFAAFLADFPPARSVACLADVARLEDAWQQAFHAEEAAALELAALAGLPAEALLSARFEAHPATRLIASDHPVASLWHAHRLERTGAPLAHYDAECALIVRPGADVQVHALPLPTQAFLQSLIAGRSFETAAMASSAAIDATQLLRWLLEVGAFTRLMTTPTEDPC
jgi:hypothetical protein